MLLGMWKLYLTSELILVENNQLFKKKKKISTVVSGDSLSSWTCPNWFWLFPDLHQTAKSKLVLTSNVF